MNKYEDPVIKGLYYIPNYLTDDETKQILTYLKKTKDWFHIGKSSSSRRVMHYGYSYAYNRSGIEKLEDVPDLFKELVTINRINEYVPELDMQNELEQLIINEYKPGQGIHPHIDHTKYFGPVIVCLTIGSGIGIDFTKDEHKRTLFVQPGSLYIMSGDARNVWRHGIKRSMYDVGKKRGIRVSLTYRTILEDDEVEVDT